MNISKYNISLNNVKKILKKYSLLKDVSTYKKKPSDELIEISKKGTYLSTYQKAIEELCYDYLLKDRSIFYFQYSNFSRKLCLRYSYYQCPYEFPTYEDYLNQNGFDYNLVGEIFLEEYEQELNEADLNKSCIPIRYDHSESEYSLGIHPVSHFHIGHANQVRIPINKLISPELFVLFVIKHVYYKLWKTIVKKDKFQKKYKKVKKLCSKIDKRYFGKLDKCELFLT